MNPLTQQEMEFYPAIFKMVDQDKDGVILSMEAVPWLQSVVLASKNGDVSVAGPLFQMLWQLSTGAALAARNPQQPVAALEFMWMMRSVACIHAGATVNDLIQYVSNHRGLPLPVFGNISYETLCQGGHPPTAAVPTQVASTPEPAPIPEPAKSLPVYSGPSTWDMSLDEWNDHTFVFRKHDLNGDGKLSGEEAHCQPLFKPIRIAKPYCGCQYLSSDSYSLHV